MSSTAPVSCPHTNEPSHLIRTPNNANEIHLVREQNHRAVDLLPPTCNLVACVGLSGTLNCVLSAISSGDTSALRHCLSGGLGQICSCAACITTVNNFLQSLGICVNADHDLTDERFDTILSILSGNVLTAASSSTFVPGSTSQLDDRRTQTAGSGREDTGT
ncbi:hypothetical protein N7493_001253 [Penicillium malachiteum]|uniref:Uncharacterized protein n=1 Tax=Penicillium malachiteum TaxID=1324776 RepID=A0AAD6HUJ5_9EURO|nr:hypothetical protein N7493_001253 [Penicillium malachiteum]